MKSNLSVLVVDDDEVYAKDISSYINAQDGLISAGYALNGLEAFEMTSITRPDAILLDILMPSLDGIGFLRRLEASVSKNKPIIIIMSQSSMPSLINSVMSRGADYFMLKPQPYSVVCDTIRDLKYTDSKIKTTESSHTEKKSMERSVSIFLRSLGIPAHLDGYKYIRDAIILAINDMGLLSPITKKLYPMIAEHYGTSKSCVERAIRHAISVSWVRGNKNMFNDIFGYSADDIARRPTNSEYIAMAADDFRLRFKYGAMLT